jgi:hypothetical protein
MSFAGTSAAARTQSLPAFLSAFLCGGLGYGRSAATLSTPSASHPPLFPPERRGGAIGRLSTPQPPLRVSAFSCGDVALRNPIDPRRRVMKHRGAFAGCIALREPLVVSQIPGQT